MRRKGFESEACPVARSLEAVGDAWSMLVVRDSFAGKRRFGEFQRSLGVAKNILADRLRKLVAWGCSNRSRPPTGPPTASTR
jgi:DNA-binding HxlR family transcriptional regulator